MYKINNRKKTPQKQLKNKQKSRKIRINKKVFYFISLIFVVIFLALISIFALLHIDPVLAANFTDDHLRPLIGNQATISLESFIFNIQDDANQIKYNFEAPSSQVFANSNYTSTDKLTPLPTSFSSSTIIPPMSSFPVLPGEGVWIPINIGTKDIEMVKTFVRPDPQRSYAIVALVKMDMSKLNFGSVAGYKEPGGLSNPGPGYIPKDIVASGKLTAAFNGGFLNKDGKYGMVVGNHTYVPLEDGPATLVIFNNAKPQIVKYEGQNFGSDVIAMRQNGPMLIENSEIVTQSAEWNMQTWGLTTTNSMYTWRSGIGITQNGDLIYAAGPSLIPQTLAEALKAAGAVNAMQLDINSAWVRFIIYNLSNNHEYTYQPLLSSMVNGGEQYLNGYQKDFFYVYKK